MGESVRGEVGGEGNYYFNSKSVYSNAFFFVNSLRNFFIFRQNHGSRLTPIADNKRLKTTKSLDIISSSNHPSTTDLILSNKTINYKLKPSRQSSRSRRIDSEKTDSSKSYKSSQRESRRRKRNLIMEKQLPSGKKLNLSHSYLMDNAGDTTTNFAAEYLSGMDQVLGLRRAFSDINLSTNWSDNKENYRHYLSSDENKVGETFGIPVTEKDFVNLIFTKGYVT